MRFWPQSFTVGVHPICYSSQSVGEHTHVFLSNYSIFLIKKVGGNITWGADNAIGLPSKLGKEKRKKIFFLFFVGHSYKVFLVAWLYLLAEMSDATDLKGAGGLWIFHLQVHSSPHTFGHADTLQQRCVHVEMIGHGVPDYTKMEKKKTFWKLPHKSFIIGRICMCVTIEWGSKLDYWTADNLSQRVIMVKW